MTSNKKIKIALRNPKHKLAVPFYINETETNESGHSNLCGLLWFIAALCPSEDADYRRTGQLAWVLIWSHQVVTCTCIYLCLGDALRHGGEESALTPHNAVLICPENLFFPFRRFSESKPILNFPHHWRDPWLLCLPWANSRKRGSAVHRG